MRNLDPSWLRGRVIGVISQEPVLFASTVKENIRYAKPSATDEEASTAQLDVFKFYLLKLMTSLFKSAFILKNNFFFELYA